MKKLILSTVGFSLFSLISNTVFAQDNADKKETSDNAAQSQETKVAAAPSSPDTFPRSDTILSQQQLDQIKKAIEKKPVTENYVHAYGLLQGNMNTTDSQRTNVPDFSGAHARAGVLASGGIVSGQVEFEFVGNQSLYAQQKIDPVSKTPYTPASSNNTVVLRQAQLNMDVLKLKCPEVDAVTTVSLGGVRVGSAMAVAPDAANATSGFSRQDGIYLQEKLKFGKELNLNLGFAAVNTLFGTTPGIGINDSGVLAPAYSGWGGNSSITMQNFWLNNSLNPSLGYVMNFNGTYNVDDARSVNLVGYYGFQKNAPYSTIGTTVGGSSQKAGNLSEARDVNHTEASLLYNDTNVFGSQGILSGDGIALWYEREQNSKTMLVSGSLTQGYNYIGGSLDDAQVASLYGIGVGADSQKYLTNMLQADDRITGAAAYTLVTSALGSAPATNQSYVVHQLAVSLGYAVNTFEVAFNFEYSGANTESFFNDANGKSLNHETHSYLTALYVF